MSPLLHDRVPEHVAGSVVANAAANVLPASAPLPQSFCGGGFAIVTVIGSDWAERPAESSAVTVTVNVPAEAHAWPTRALRTLLPEGTV
jgi:hypothetical protein